MQSKLNAARFAFGTRRGALASLSRPRRRVGEVVPVFHGARGKGFGRSASPRNSGVSATESLGITVSRMSLLAVFPSHALSDQRRRALPSSPPPRKDTGVCGESAAPVSFRDRLSYHSFCPSVPQTWTENRERTEVAFRLSLQPRGYPIYMLQEMTSSLEVGPIS
eukprot:scaffold442_cov268-Pinguiococcus_pyrenoidosus.AAC.47